MAVPTVSTYSIMQTAINNVAKVQGELSTAQQQLSSGQKSSDFTGISADSEQYLSIDNIISKTDQYLRDNSVIDTRMTATSNAIKNVIDIATKLSNLLATRTSGSSNTASFYTSIQNLWQQMTVQLNTTVNNQYMFSGSKTNVKPVDSDNFPTLAFENSPEVDYYSGSKQDITARARDNITLTYNVRADNPAFQKLMTGLAQAKEANELNNTAKLVNAQKLVQDGLQELIGVQASLGAVQGQFNDINVNLSNEKLYWRGIQESIGNTDIVSVSTEVAVNQSVLQAAFQAFAKITSLRLADYLK